MKDNTVPLLTAEDAVGIQHSDKVCGFAPCPKIAAIAAGRAVVIPRRTEKEWRAEFEASDPYPEEHLKPFATIAAIHRWQEAWESRMLGWLAALRHAGVIVETTK